MNMKCTARQDPSKWAAECTVDVQPGCSLYGEALLYGAFATSHLWWGVCLCGGGLELLTSHRHHSLLFLPAASPSYLQDGRVCIHHLPSSQLLCSLQCATEPSSSNSSDEEVEVAVGAVAWHPKSLPSNAFQHSSSSSSDGRCWLLYAGVGRELLVLLLLLLPDPAAAAAGQQAGASSIEQQQAAAGSSDTAAAAAAADDDGGAQLRVLLREAVSSDDISSVSVNAAGTYLAAADDTGGYRQEFGSLFFCLILTHFSSMRTSPGLTIAIPDCCSLL